MPDERKSKRVPKVDLNLPKLNSIPAFPKGSNPQEIASKLDPIVKKNMKSNQNIFESLVGQKGEFDESIYRSWVQSPRGIDPIGYAGLKLSLRRQQPDNLDDLFRIAPKLNFPKKAPKTQPKKKGEGKKQKGVKGKEGEKGVNVSSGKKKKSPADKALQLLQMPKLPIPELKKPQIDAINREIRFYEGWREKMGVGEDGKVDFFHRAKLLGAVAFRTAASGVISGSVSGATGALIDKGLDLLGKKIKVPYLGEMIGGGLAAYEWFAKGGAKKKLDKIVQGYKTVFNSDNWQKQPLTTLADLFVWIGDIAGTIADIASMISTVCYVIAGLGILLSLIPGLQAVASIVPTMITVGRTAGTIASIAGVVGSAANFFAAAFRAAAILIESSDPALLAENLGKFQQEFGGVIQNVSSAAVKDKVNTKLQKRAYDKLDPQTKSITPPPEEKTWSRTISESFAKQFGYTPGKDGESGTFFKSEREELANAWKERKLIKKEIDSLQKELIYNAIGNKKAFDKWLESRRNAATSTTMVTDSEGNRVRKYRHESNYNESDLSRRELERYNRLVSQGASEEELLNFYKQSAERRVIYEKGTQSAKSANVFLNQVMGESTTSLQTGGRGTKSKGPASVISAMQGVGKLVTAENTNPNNDKDVKKIEETVMKAAFYLGDEIKDPDWWTGKGKTKIQDQEWYEKITDKRSGFQKFVQNKYMNKIFDKGASGMAAEGAVWVAMDKGWDTVFNFITGDKYNILSNQGQKLITTKFEGPPADATYVALANHQMKVADLDASMNIILARLRVEKKNLKATEKNIKAHLQLKQQADEEIKAGIEGQKKILDERKKKVTKADADQKKHDQDQKAKTGDFKSKLKVVLPLLKIVKGGIDAADSIPGVDASGSSKNIGEMIKGIQSYLEGDKAGQKALKGSEKQVEIYKKGQEKVGKGLQEEEKKLADYNSVLEKRLQDEKLYKELSTKHSDELKMRFRENMTERTLQYTLWKQKSEKLENWAFKQFKQRAELGFSDKMVSAREPQLKEVEQERKKWKDEYSKWKEMPAQKRVAKILKDL